MRGILLFGVEGTVDQSAVECDEGLTEREVVEYMGGPSGEVKRVDYLSASGEGAVEASREAHLAVWRARRVFALLR